MGLFSPWFLAGLLALGLPLWLHLLRQFKKTPQPFSSLMFFERQIQSSSKHRRLRYLRLLALRLALLALLALLFANPFIKRDSLLLAPRKRTVVAVDNSFSMRYQNRLSDAKAQAAQLSGELFAVGNKTARVSSIEASDEASSYGEFARAMRLYEETKSSALDVHLFTDAQQTSMPNAFADLRLGPLTSLTIHEIGKGAAANWAVETVSVPARVFDSSTFRLTAVIKGWDTNETTKNVSVILNGRSIASRSVTVPAAGRVEAQFDNLPIAFGAAKGEVRISPNDDLPNDDRFNFSIERSDPQKVLFLGRPAESLFYKAALESSAASGLKVSDNDSDFSPYALIVLNNPGTLDRETSDRLTQYVSNGGALWIAAGPATVRAGTIAISGEAVSGTREEIDGNVHFSAAARITPSAGDRITQKFSDEMPIKIERTLGEGRILIFASTLDQATSDFPVHASYVPFILNTSAELAGSVGGRSSVTVGDAIPLRRSNRQSASVDVIGPDGKHEIALGEATRATAFTPEREGFYQIQTASGKHFQIAVNADRRESNLAKVPAETLLLWRNTGVSSSNVAGKAQAVSEPFSLWRYVLILVLIAAVVESIFASRYLSEERRAA